MAPRAWAVALLVLALLPRRARSEVEEEKPKLAFTFGKFWITPILGPGYTPELGFLIAGGTLVSYKFDDESPRSSAPISLSYSSTGALVFTVKPSLYLLQDQLRIDAYLGIKDMTDNYFGVGYDLGNSTKLGESTTQYHRDYKQLNGGAMWRIRPNLYFGGWIDFNRTDATQLAPQMAQDPTIVAQGTYFKNTGVGPILRYDSRDVPENAFEGVYFQAQYLFYRPGLGGTTNFSIVDLDYRQYLSLDRPGVTLAWNFRTRHGSGDQVPWTELSLLGSATDLRGYREGRYRDNTILYGIVEFRWMDFKGMNRAGQPKFGLNGVVSWIGAGTMGSSYAHLNCLLPNFGVGYRIVVQDRMAIRLDMGAGRESTGFYFSFNEAF
ncbi:MAG TPA: BamA/TamA family outer membrane protein [Myxococcales bacterium]|nr:BamA/TamA family outer membrane protein [Myxococcales bacterium]